MTDALSASFAVGLLGVQTKISLVCGVTAARTAATSIAKAGVSGTASMHAELIAALTLYIP